MAIDASVYGQIKAPRENNPLAQYAQVSQIQNMQNQARLADLAYGEKEREVADTRTMNEAYRGALGADGKIDRMALTRAIAERGAGSKIPAIQKGFAETDKATTEADAKSFELRIKKSDQAMKDIASFTSPEQAIANLKQHVQSGDITPDRAQMILQGIPQDPAKFPEWQAGMLKKIMTAKEQLQYSMPDANALLSAQTAAAGRDVTMRGQDMTDTRARDLNATKADEAKLKREAKDETTQLTKNSQIASFDTMLGTLDRLSKHPGLARSVGVVGALPTMPGSDSANFQAELNTFQSQAFIPMVAQLKGMGALSDAEGKKLTAAVGALDPKMGEEAFRASVARITADMQAARDRMTGGGKAPAAGASGTTGSWDESRPATVSNAADYAKIPSGATYTDPSGKMRRKP